MYLYPLKFKTALRCIVTKHMSIDHFCWLRLLLYMFYVVYDTLYYRSISREKVIKNVVLEVDLWGCCHVFFFFSPMSGGGSPKFCATMRGWVMFFWGTGFSFPPAQPACTFWPAPNLSSFNCNDIAYAILCSKSMVAPGPIKRDGYVQNDIFIQMWILSPNFVSKFFGCLLLICFHSFCCCNMNGIIMQFKIRIWNWRRKIHYFTNYCDRTSLPKPTSFITNPALLFISAVWPDFSLDARYTTFTITYIPYLRR